LRCDGDFRALVAALQLRGKRVSIVSTLQTQPAMVADELRRQADQFIDLADLEELIGRDPSARPVREPREGGAERPERRDMPVRTTPARGRSAAAAAPASASTLSFPDDDDAK
jgi:hypothetical protein